MLKAAKANSQPGTPQHELYEKPKVAGMRRRTKKKQDEIFITSASRGDEVFTDGTVHVAAILQRQDFVLRLARALMMFGAPTHRIESQIQATARTLDIHCQVMCVHRGSQRR